ncbi:hypothetical protein A8950_1323 [Dongia mobilis]|uniref:Uncharacterized protein n=1 Tax=Dongia mobilis TaxID=578943 RepID=A0A4R6WPA2_9PROT|nr:hypothetical protein [Dongia mobilis]TDQ83041.1 hypothetical protein A8950_1323 [Dongia mobilis]
MTDKRNGPGDLRNGHVPGRERAPNKRPDGGTGGAEIVSLHSSPAFDLWLERQMHKLADASAAAPREALIDLIRHWPNRGKLKDHN